MDKSQHIVTVPREYLEMLEEAYEKYKLSQLFNIRGDKRTVAYSYKPDEAMLFLQSSGLTEQRYDKVIVINSQGEEKAVYKIESYFLG